MLMNDAKAKRRSQAIDRALKEDDMVRRRRWNVLLLGDNLSMRELIVSLKNHNDRIVPIDDELLNCHHNIHRCVVTYIETLLEAMNGSDVRLQTTVNNSHCEYLRRHIDESESGDLLSEKVAKVVEVLWGDPHIQEAFSSSRDTNWIDSAQYFFKHISRITAPDYIPSRADISKLQTGTGVFEYQFEKEGSTVVFVDVRANGERRKWIRQFADVHALLFIADLASYDEVMSEVNTLESQIQLFENVVNFEPWRRATVVLFLSNVGAFRKKLGAKPLGRYFEDYEGGSDVRRVEEYLIKRFRQVNREGVWIYEYLVELGDTANIDLVFAAIKAKIRSCKDKGA
ncbi:Guanine nucleotide-binding protein alpha-2 subunit [Kalmusia sp. IMI 367209]|nr:Guanine nucleotide-binding protein alpha-2 subunit [Kalmusia sp. IMI 367209]